MNPYSAYRKNEPSTGWTRIDLLLALYDGAIERIEKAEAMIQRGDRAGASPLAAKAQLIVTELAAGVRTEVNPDTATNTLRLYEFVVHQLKDLKPEGLLSARRVLKTLREGFEAIRIEASDMERNGHFPAAERLQMVSTNA
jgi:flagellin-specific chaperone FliS